MIGFDPNEEFGQLRHSLLEKHKIFTGNAKPNVIRLLPGLNIGNSEISHFFNAMDALLITDKAMAI
jgi:acetylornithine aminotransferase